MGLKTLLSEIKQKKEELRDLNERVDDLAKKEFNYLVGKYFLLAATSRIKVTGIMYIEENRNTVIVECIRIQGGKYDLGRIHVEINDDYPLRLEEIEDSTIKEISQDDFNEFLIEALEVTREKIIESCV